MTDLLDNPFYSPVTARLNDFVGFYGYRNSISQPPFTYSVADTPSPVTRVAPERRRELKRISKFVDNFVDSVIDVTYQDLVTRMTNNVALLSDARITALNCLLLYHKNPRDYVEYVNFKPLAAYANCNTNIRVLRSCLHSWIKRKASFKNNLAQHVSDGWLKILRPTNTFAFYLTNSYGVYEFLFDDHMLIDEYPLCIRCTKPPSYLEEGYIHPGILDLSSKSTYQIENTSVASILESYMLSGDFGGVKIELVSRYGMRELEYV